VLWPDGERAVGQVAARLGGVSAIAGAVEILVDRLYDNATANRNAAVAAFHAERGHAGFKFLVTAWSIEQTGGPKCYPGRDMTAAHERLHVTEDDFDTVAPDIAATLSYVGVPAAEHQEFTDIIESYRTMVVETGTAVTVAAASAPVRA